jgi:hypothetical protein
MRGGMSAGPAYVALILAAAAALLFVLLPLADIVPKANAIAGAIAENPSVMIPP